MQTECAGDERGVDGRVDVSGDGGDVAVHHGGQRRRLARCAYGRRQGVSVCLSACLPVSVCLCLCVAHPRTVVHVNMQAVPLSCDHKPSRPDEMKRIDKSEIMTRKAVVLARLGEVEKSKTLLKHAIWLAKKGAHGAVLHNVPLAEAEYEMGLIYFKEMSAIKLSLPVSRMREDIGAKMKAFRQSQKHLLNSVSGHVKLVSTGAGEPCAVSLGQFRGCPLTRKRELSLISVYF